MMSLDGKVGGPQGQVDWIADDEALNQDHLARLQQAELLMLGAGVIPEMSGFWTTAEQDTTTDDITRAIGRSMNEAKKIVYSHKAAKVDWHNAEVHVVSDNAAFLKDVRHVERKTAGPIIVYGGARMANSFLKHDLVDEIHLDICPIILGEGLALFAGIPHRTNLRLLEAVTYDSGAIMMRYEVEK